jgi:hypothetical protein
VAGFYANARQAEAVAATLRRQHGLGRSQLAVINPAGLTRRAFRREARQWQQHRPRGAWRHTLRQAPRHLAVGAAAGLLTGGLAALVGHVGHVGHALLAGPDMGPQAWAWLQLGGWAGAVAGIAAAAAVAAFRPRHRFDETMRRKLRQGQCAVVVHGLSTDDEAPVLAYLQATSHSWCAEAPERVQPPQRLQRTPTPTAGAPARPWRGPVHLGAR